MAGPLEGLRVVDASWGTAGPRLTGLLADYGADVVRIEPSGGDPFQDLLAAQYAVFNRGKRSVVLDLRREDARARVGGLLASADLFVETWSPGTAERLGLGYEELHRRYPRLVCCSISGFGQEGPNRDVPGYEPLVHALVGTMGEQPGWREGPIFEGVPFASIGAAYLAAIGVLGALLRREEDGTGRHVETSLLDGALAYLSMLWGEADVSPPPRDPGGARLIARNFMCADGEYMGVHTGAVGAFGRLMQLVGLDDRIPPSATGLDMGVPLEPDQRILLHERLPEIFAGEPRATWIDRLTAADVCAIPLNSPLAVFDEPQVLNNGMRIELDDPVLGTVQQVGPPLSFSETPGQVNGPAPRIGEHTAEVLDAAPAPTATVEPGRPDATRPLLDGVRVLDLGQYFAAPYASRLLADLGADVIRLETLLGDPNRRQKVIFRSSHAGKRSIAVDLKTPDGRAVVEDLMAWADIVHHNMRPGAAERLGVSYDDASLINPAVIYAWAPGWGPDGPYRDRQSFAPLMSGFVGAAHEAAGRFNAPVYPSGNEDPANGLLGAIGMLMGLFHRRSTGKGQRILHIQLNAALTHVQHIVRRPDGEAVGELQLDPLQFGQGPLERLYKAADGWICIVAPFDRHVAGLDKVFGTDLLGDPRFATPDARDANADALEAALMPAFASRTSADLVSELTAAGVPAAVPVPHNAVSFLRDPDQRRLGRTAEVPGGEDGNVRELAVLVRTSDTTVAPHRLAPQLGEHTDEILASLGRSPQQISDLRARKVVG
jgi:crotonobetainyl-CoA:carnitine CoA-transferase CaiB-like acyl-CoA transferase